MMLVMEILRASADNWPALAELFTAGGDPKWCWCEVGRIRNWTRTTE
jgi:hypothetical protein